MNINKKIIFIIFSFLLLSTTSILWSTIRYGISPMPSNQEARKAMLNFASQTTPKMIFELGSGWGKLAHELAILHPDSMVYGYERSWLPFLFSKFFFRFVDV